MTPQETSSSLIEDEKRIVMGLAGISDPDAITLNDSGWDSRVYAVRGSQYFVKFPRSEKIRGRYAYQVAALKLAAGIRIANLSVPRLVWEHPTNNYFGYTGVEGEPLSDVLPNLDEASKQQIGETLGSFLVQLHRLQLPEARDMSIEEEIKQLQTWYEKGLPRNQALFSEHEGRKLRSAVYTTWPERLREFGSVTSLCHGDFHFKNIFYTNTRQIGVIDFGDVCYSDHSKDFINLDDAVILESALAAYGTSDKTILDKIALRRTMLQVVKLTAQLAKNEHEAIPKTVAILKAALA